MPLLRFGLRSQHIGWGFNSDTPSSERYHFCHIVAGVYAPDRHQ